MHYSVMLSVAIINVFKKSIDTSAEECIICIHLCDNSVYLEQSNVSPINYFEG